MNLKFQLVFTFRLFMLRIKVPFKGYVNIELPLEMVVRPMLKDKIKKRMKKFLKELPKEVAKGMILETISGELVIDDEVYRVI